MKINIKLDNHHTPTLTPPHLHCALAVRIVDARGDTPEALPLHQLPWQLHEHIGGAARSRVCFFPGALPSMIP